MKRLPTVSASGHDQPIRLFVPEVLLDPYPTYAFLRERFPVYREPELGAYLLTRWADVTAALRDPKTFSSARVRLPYDRDKFEHPELVPPVGDYRLPMQNDDPPRHGRLRSLVNRAFTLRRVALLEPWLRQFVDELLDGIRPGESVDVVRALAAPLPTAAITEMLGVPAADRDQFRRWGDLVLLDAASAADSGAAMRAMARRLVELVAERRQAPRDDLVSALAHATVEGEPLDDETLAGLLVLVFNGGNETTTHLLSSFLDVMVDRPDLWEALRSELNLVESAIEETLRYEAPAPFIWRAAARDVSLHGVTIPEGAIVGIGLGAANRDPEKFPDPDTFRIDRDPEQLAFAHGIHYCVGAPLTRLEARVAILAMLERYPRITRGDEPPERLGTAAIRGFRRLPLRFFR